MNRWEIVKPFTVWTIIEQPEQVLRRCTFLLMALWWSCHYRAAGYPVFVRKTARELEAKNGPSSQSKSDSREVV